MGCGISRSKEKVNPTIKTKRIEIKKQLDALTREEKITLLINAIEKEKICDVCCKSIKKPCLKNASTQTDTFNHVVKSSDKTSSINVYTFEKSNKETDNSPQINYSENHLIIEDDTINTTGDDNKYQSGKNLNSVKMETVQEVESKLELPIGDTPKNLIEISQSGKLNLPSRQKLWPQTPNSLSGIITTPKKTPKDSFNNQNISKIPKLGTENFIQEEDISVSSGSLMTLKTSNLAATYRIGVKNHSDSSCSEISENDFEFTGMVSPQKPTGEVSKKNLKKLPDIDYGKKAEELAKKILKDEKFDKKNVKDSKFNPNMFGFKRSITVQSKNENKFVSARACTPSVRSNAHSNIHGGFSKYLKKQKIEVPKPKKKNFVTFKKFDDRKFLSQQGVIARNKNIVFAKNTPDVIKDSITSLKQNKN